MLDPVGNFGLSSAVGGSAGSGGGNLTTNEAIYEPFAPPEVANDMNEELRVDIGDFTEFDIDDIMTYSIDTSGLKVSIGTTPTNHSVSGFLKSLPVGYGDFSIEAHVFHRGKKDVNLTYALAGIMLSNGTSNTSHLFTYSLVTGYNVANSLYAHNWDNYNTPAAVDPTTALMNLSNSSLDVFLRIRKNGTTYEFDYSPDGRSWHFIYSINSFYFTPTHCGLMFENMNSTGTDQYGGYSFFRYVDENVGAGGAIGGRRVWGLGSVISGGAAPVAAGTIYNPFAAPATPHALDAEFTSGILPLTEFDLDNVMTPTVDDRGVVLTIAATSNATTIAGLLQALPNGFSSFTIESRVAQYITDSINNTYIISGIMLTDGTASNSKIYSWSLATGYNIEHSLYTHYFSDYHTFNTGIAHRSFGKEVSGLFLRIRKDNTNYYFDYSLEGMSWLHIVTVAIASFPFTPTHFGIMFEYVASDGTPQATVFSFLRYKASDVTPRGFIGGRRVNYYTP